MSAPIIKYKHQVDIEKWAKEDCPPLGAVSIERDVYRFVNNPMTDKDFFNHIQLGKLPPQTDKKHKLACSHCGISLYFDFDGAKKKYQSFPKKENFPYTHIAKGGLKKSDGVCTKEDKVYTHFTLHEYDTSNIKPETFIIIEPLS